MNNPKQLNLDVKLDEAINLNNFIICPSTEIILKASKDFISGSDTTKTFFYGERREREKIIFYIL